MTVARLDNFLFPCRHIDYFVHSQKLIFNFPVAKMLYTIGNYPVREIPVSSSGRPMPKMVM